MSAPTPTRARAIAVETATATEVPPRTHRHSAYEDRTTGFCPFGCEYTCDLCEPDGVTDASDGDFRLGVAIGVAVIVIWLVSVIGLVL